MEEVTVGNIAQPDDVKSEVGELVSLLSEKYEFKNGETAAFLHLCVVLHQHIGQGKK